MLPTTLVWDSFGIGNGATTIVEMRARIEKYRKQRPAPHEDYQDRLHHPHAALLLPARPLDPRSRELAPEHRPRQDVLA